jgi:hypothetical protein
MKIMFAAKELELFNSKDKNLLSAANSELVQGYSNDVNFCSIGGVADYGKTIIVNYTEFSVSSANHAGKDILSILDDDDIDMDNLKNTLKSHPEVILKDSSGIKFLLSLKPRYIKLEKNINMGSSDLYADHFFLEFGWVQCLFNKNSKLCWALASIN